jgi:hypothetical protein
MLYALARPEGAKYLEKQGWHRLPADISTALARSEIALARAVSPKPPLATIFSSTADTAPADPVTSKRLVHALQS